MIIPQERAQKAAERICSYASIFYRPEEGYLGNTIAAIILEAMTVEEKPILTGETPRTDFEATLNPSHLGKYVPTRFARQLERELNTLKQHLKVEGMKTAVEACKEHGWFPSIQTVYQVEQIQQNAYLAGKAEGIKCIAFFASVIKSGEPWTNECQQAYDKAM